MNPDEIAAQMAHAGQITQEFANSISDQSEVAREEMTPIDTAFNSDGFIFNNIENNDGSTYIHEAALDIARRGSDQIDNTIFDSLRGSASVPASIVSNANTELTNAESIRSFYREYDQQELYIDHERITQQRQRTTDVETSTEDLDLILEKADLYHIDLGPEAMLESLQAISKMISADTDVSDAEVVDYIDGFLQKIGVR